MATPADEGMTPKYHVPVLLKEVILGLQIEPSGTYVDCTFGGGGHSRAVLAELNEKGRLLVFDQDADAIQNLPDDKRVTFIPHNFRHLQRFLKLHNVSHVNGMLADLGVSSHQFDEPARGFSTRFEGMLDMRMDKRQEQRAFDIISTYTEQRLHKMFEQYGEVTNSKTLARMIVEVRENVSLETITNFKNALQAIVKGNPQKYFAQVFQALRIEINDELGSLKDMLSQVPQVLISGGRIAVITFHSLEDRIVKQFFKKGNFEEEEEENPFINRIDRNPFKIITKKPVVPGEEELSMNPRARSAKLRIAEKIE
ncbi:MAG TPA: 16S rRNA (cytosine(1402)-N(4))-methyltransferase RsmH [Flavitalea sp.]|nr:16S rRNA (cytosine(1402)-N(4))-methyltransferase RsmH [Flavitalea sp.]